MASGVVRVKLPGSVAFVPALIEAAEKYAARRAFTEARKAEFCAGVEQLLWAVAEREPQVIEIVFDEGTDGVDTTVRGLQADDTIVTSKALTVPFT